MGNGGSKMTRLGAVGLGYWGPNLLRNLVEMADVEVRWCCDLDRGALARVGRRYPAIPTTQVYDEVLRDPDVEAVVIATPVASHHPLARAALESGKHVFVEKPLAASSDSARELIELAAQHGLVLMPGHTFLYSPPVNAIKDLISRRELGEIYFISTSRVNLGLHQQDTSVVWDLAPHDFSILRYWLEERPVRVSAVSRACVFPDVPDVAFIHLEFGSGIICQVELSWLAPSKLRRTAIVGSDKMIVYDDTSNEPVRIFDSGVIPPNPQTFGEFQLSYRTGDIVSPPVRAVEPLALELRDFCSAIRTGIEPRSSSAMGLDVVLMIEAVDRSLRRDGAVVPVAARDEDRVAVLRDGSRE
jgi:predicted dehydrogenase